MSNSDNQKEAMDALVLVSEMIQEKDYVSMSKFFNDMFSAYGSKMKKEVVPQSIEPSYSGIHLGEKYEESDFLQLVDNFDKGNMLHAKYALKIIEDATNRFKRYSNIALLDVKKMQNKLRGFVIVGDLHGSFKDLKHIIDKFGVPGKYYRFVFNGDLVDRGPQQCEVLLTVLYACLLYPTRVIINRGNHEDVAINMSRHFNPNFKKDTELKFNQYGLTLFNRSQEMFRHLPLASIIVNNAGFRVFITHGGLSEKIDIKKISTKNLKRSDFDVIQVRKGQGDEILKASQLITDLLWSDPIPIEDKKSSKLGTRFNRNRGAGCLFDEKVSYDFCQNNGFNCIVRSHECRQDGFTHDQPFCFTVFSVSNYCNGNNQAAVLFLDDEGERLDFYQYQIEETNQKVQNENRKYILSSFKSFLDRKSSSLVKYFREADIENRGFLEIEKWATILAKYITYKVAYISSKHIIALKDYLCECDDQYANYQSMFSPKTLPDPTVMEYLETVFDLIDKDNSGAITEDEAYDAIDLMNSSLKTNYSTKFIAQMDLNKDGLIDLKEFQQSFINTLSSK